MEPDEILATICPYCDNEISGSILDIARHEGACEQQHWNKGKDKNKSYIHTKDSDGNWKSEEVDPDNACNP